MTEFPYLHPKFKTMSNTDITLIIGSCAIIIFILALYLTFVKNRTH